MKRYGPLISLPLLILAGCAQVKDDSPTLKNLERRSISVEKDTAIPDSRNKAIESYQSVIDSAKDKSMQSEAKRKIADLEIESTEARFLERVKKSEAAAKENKTPNNETPALPENSTAIKLYQELLQDPTSKPSDESTLYQLAKAYEQRGDYQKTLEALTRLVTTYPKIKYLDEVQFRRGEILFTLKDYGQAEKAYAAVLPMKKSQFHEMALYKFGWSLYKQEKYSEAVDSLFLILDGKLTGRSSLTDDLALPESQQEFIKDTLRVIALSFYHMDGPTSVTSYLSTKGHRPYEFLIYRQLGDLNLEKDRINNAIDSYSAFVKEYPAHPQSMIMRQNIADVYKKAGLYDLSLEEKRGFVRAYDEYNDRRAGNAPKTYAEHIIYSDTNAQEKIAAYLKTNIEELASYYHSKSQSIKTHQAYLQAAEWYRKFLKNFPDDAKAVKMHFMVAEVLYEDGQYLEAIRHYESVAYQYPANENSAEAGYAALLAYKAHEKKLSGYEKNVWRRNAVVSALRFTEKYPKDARVPATLASAAEELFSLKQYDKAEYAAKLLLNKGSQIESKLRQTALTIVAHADFERGAYEHAEENYRALLDILPAGDAAKGGIIENLAVAIYKQGEKERIDGNTRMAINHFMRMSQSAPMSQLRISAEYEAAVGYITLSEWGNALRLLDYIQRSFPGHALQPDVLRQLVLVYIQSNQPIKAAATLEKIMMSSTQDVPSRQAAGWQAAELYQNANDTKSAISVYSRYVQLFPTPLEQAIEARNRLAAAYQRINDANMQSYWLREIINAEKAGGDERNDRTRLAAAKAAMTLAGPAYEAFRGIRLVEPLQENMKLKKESMEAAIQAYAVASTYGVADITTSATYHMAKIYSDFSRDLLDSQRPAGLSPVELEQYDVLLEEQAFPFEEKAIQIHESNVQRVSAGIYDESVKLSFAELAKLLPARFAKQEKNGVPGDSAANVQSADEEEKVLLAAIAVNPKNIEAYNRLGILYRNDGRFADARDIYEKALVIAPDYKFIHLNIGILYDLYLRNLDLALDHYRRYQKLLPEADKQVSLWISDLEKRTRASEKARG